MPYPSFAAHPTSWMQVFNGLKNFYQPSLCWKRIGNAFLDPAWLTLNPQLLTSLFPLTEGSTRYILSWADRLNLKAQCYPKSILGYCAENYPQSRSHPGALTSFLVGMQREQPDPSRCHPRSRQRRSLQWHQFSCHVSAAAWKGQQDPSRGCPSAEALFGWPSPMSPR